MESDIINSLFLISKRIVDEEGRESFDSFCGKAIYSDDESLKILKSDDEVVDLPPFGEGFYTVAEDGIYELNGGEICEHPDYYGQFVVYTSKEAWEKFSEQNRA